MCCDLLVFGKTSLIHQNSIKTEIDFQSTESACEWNFDWKNPNSATRIIYRKTRFNCRRSQSRRAVKNDYYYPYFQFVKESASHEWNLKPQTWVFKLLKQIFISAVHFCFILGVHGEGRKALGSCNFFSICSGKFKGNSQA